MDIKTSRFWNKSTLFKIMGMSIISIMAYLSFATVDYGDGQSSRIVAEDHYKFILHLRVPQVRNNSNSTGYRRFEYQSIRGTFMVNWHEDGSRSYSLVDCQNRSFKVGGNFVTYNATVGDDIMYTRFNYIGYNSNNLFKIPVICTSLILEPSYAISEANEDNSFYLVLSGSGSSAMKGGNRIATSMSGRAVGTQGCGCTDYGHKSPTRGMGIQGPTNAPEDAVGTYGNWTLRWTKRVWKSN